MLKIAFIGMAAAFSAAPAAAQDAYLSPMDFATQRQVLINSVISNIAVGDAAKKSDSPGIKAARGGPSAPRFNSGSRPSDAPMPYVTSLATQRAELRAYLARNRARSPKLAADLDRAFVGVNVHQRFAEATRANGLRADDTADVMAAFLLAGYEIITGHEPTVAETRGVRRQVAGQLLNAAELRNPAARTQFSEELKIQFVVLGSGYVNARSGDERARYRKGVAQYYRSTTGQDIGRMRLTTEGFASS